MVHSDAFCDLCSTVFRGRHRLLEPLVYTLYIFYSLHKSVETHLSFSLIQQWKPTHKHIINFISFNLAFTKWKSLIGFGYRCRISGINHMLIYIGSTNIRVTFFYTYQRACFSDSERWTKLCTKR